jgi:hypothetical protein
MSHEPFGDRPIDLPGTFELPPDCPIWWRPNALAPVFYGVRDIYPDPIALPRIAGRRGRSGAKVAAASTELMRLLDLGALGPARPPARMRVLFPSLGAPPQNAEILAPCGLYPLIVFAHGQCVAAQGEVYQEWANGRLVTQLAKAGYVVAVPELTGAGPTDPADLETLRRVIAWMRSDWEHRDLLAATTGLIGHSNGGVLAGTVTNEGGIDAFAELSAAWGEASADIRTSIAVPQLHVSGGEETPPESPAVYEQAQLPKHGVIIDAAGHYDYLAGSPCQPRIDACACTPGIAADVATMFFGRYLPPPAVPDLAQQIGPLLRPPVVLRAPEQELYVEGYLTGFSCIASHLDACSITLAYEDGSGGRTESIPWSDDVRDHRTS